MKRAFFGLAFFLFLISPVQASTFLNIYLDEDGSALFLGETTSSSLDLPSGINLDNNQILGKTQTLTSKSQEVWFFSYSLNNSEISLQLPKGTTLLEISSGEIYLDNNQISIFFKDEIEIAYTVDPQEDSGDLNMLIIILVAIIALVLGYLKRKPSKGTNKEILKKVLSNREKLILDSLEKSGKIKQNYLCKLTKIPKASFSRHLQELERKDLIKRSGEGKNKFVELI